MVSELQVDKDRFAEAASMWHGIARTLHLAGLDVAETNGGGDRFGLLALPIHSAHDDYSETITTALDDGATAAMRVAGALLNAARDFHATDAAVSADHRRILKEIK